MWELVCGCVWCRRAPASLSLLQCTHARTHARTHAHTQTPTHTQYIDVHIYMCVCLGCRRGRRHRSGNCIVACSRMQRLVFCFLRLLISRCQEAVCLHWLRVEKLELQVQLHTCATQRVCKRLGCCCGCLFFRRGLSFCLRPGLSHCLSVCVCVSVALSLSLSPLSGQQSMP